MGWRAGIVGAPLLALLASSVGAGQDVLSASYADPTRRYGHGILGDDVEWGTLVLQIDTCAECARVTRETRRIILPKSRVFEDLAPRVQDLDGDGLNEVIVIETDTSQGARLSVYGPEGLIAATPYIGRTHRWLAPVGAADLDGDGAVEIAYVDRPHLAKTLRIWRYQNGKLSHVADQPGLTNHRIGEDFISGGIRDCGQGPEIVTVDAGWQQIVATRFDGTAFNMTDVAPFNGPDSFAPVLACRR